MTQRKTTVVTKIKVGKDQSGMYVHELLVELNLRKIGDKYPSVTVNGLEKAELIDRVYTDDVIELSVKV